MKRIVVFLLFISILFICSCKKKNVEQPSQNQETESISENSSSKDNNNGVFSTLSKKLKRILDTDEEEEEDFETDDTENNEELENLENDLNMQSPIIQMENDQTSEIPDAEIEPVEKRLLDSKNRLKFMEYNGEIFIPENNKEKYTVQVDSNSENYIRFFYDDEYNLVKKETWKISTYKNSKILSTEEYEYNAADKKLTKKITISLDSKTITSFNKDGLVNKYQVMELYKDSKTEKEKYLQKSISEYEYNKDNQLIVEKQIDYTYDMDKLIKTKEKKQKYKYHPVIDSESSEEIPPDYEYYEDGILKIETNYKSKGDYTTRIKFSETMNVTTYYENYKKIKDVYTEKGIVKRVKNYE